MKREYRELAKAAQSAKLNAFAPFSKFRVGAAIFSDEGKKFTGCNTANSAYGLTICAERVAIFDAISNGVTKFKAIVVVSYLAVFIPPCGACRQVLFDLAGNIDFVMRNSKDQVKIMKLNSLLHFAFTGTNLK